MANTNLFSAILLSATRLKGSLLLAGALLAPLLSHSLLGESVWAGPVVCTTTLEPPLLGGGRSGAGADPLIRCPDHRRLFERFRILVHCLDNGVCRAKASF